jgi:hypothetical protein
MNLEKHEMIIASSPDGIGIEIWRNNNLIIEVRRNDTKKTRTITLYEKDLPLNLIEECIQAFKKDIPWDYQD